jgi:hypothetical protein
MPNSFRRPVFAGTTLLVPALLLCLFTLPASPALGQESTPPTRLQKQLAKIDLGLVAAGELSTSDSGVEQRDANTTHSLLTIKPSSTVGELGTLRYTAKPWVGFEFNVGNLRYTQDYTFVPPPEQTILTGGVQSGVREMTLGYVAHLKYRPFGITPYLGAGGGTIKFTPTSGGGQHLPFQYRAAYYYQLGFEDNFPNSPFGMRLGFRQLIYLAPDFLQNYLTITRRTRTSEPTIGFFVRF